jgi:hypothetical protein
MDSKQMIVADTLRIIPVLVHPTGFVICFTPEILSGKDLRISIIRRWVPLGKRLRGCCVCPCKNPKIAEYDLVIFFTGNLTESLADTMQCWMYFEKDVMYRPMTHSIPDMDWDWFKLRYQEYIHNTATESEKHQ